MKPEERLAKMMHDKYEQIAKKKKWNTQEKCKVEFESLPKKNKETMIELAREIIKYSNQRTIEMIEKAKEINKLENPKIANASVHHAIMRKKKAEEHKKTYNKEYLIDYSTIANKLINR